MYKFEVKFDKRQLNRVKNLVKEGERRLATNLKYIVNQTAEDIVTDSQADMLMGTKTGRVYPKAKGKTNHQASAMGETPAVITGNLMKSFKIEKMGYGGGEYAKISNKAEYAAKLFFELNRPLVIVSADTKEEFKNRVRMAARDAMSRYQRKR